MEIKSFPNKFHRKRLADFLRRRWLTLVLLIALAGLFLYALSGVEFAEVRAVLRRLSAGQILLLAGMNGVIVLVLNWRWWWLLKILGYRTAFGGLTLDRLSAFAVSYLTPGAHFGGEPLQVLTLQRCHGVAAPAAILSVGLDKVFEMFLNGLVIAALPGLLLLVHGGVGLSRQPLFWLTPLLIFLVSTIIFLWFIRQPRPLSALVEKYGQRVLRPARFESVHRTVSQVEGELRSLPGRGISLLLGGSAISLIGWLLMIGEFWLMLYLLNPQITVLQMCFAYCFARAANWVPVPAAAGALEAGQVLALGLAGVALPVALGLVLLIRLRDLAFATIGIGWGGVRYYGLRSQAEIERG